MHEDGPGLSRRQIKKQQGAQGRNKVQQETDVSSEKRNGSPDRGQKENLNAVPSEHRNGRPDQGQQEIAVTSEPGKGYPEDFWSKIPEFDISQDDAPAYCFGILMISFPFLGRGKRLRRTRS